MNELIEEMPFLALEQVPEEPQDLFSASFQQIALADPSPLSEAEFDWKKVSDSKERKGSKETNNLPAHKSIKDKSDISAFEKIAEASIWEESDGGGHAVFRVVMEYQPYGLENGAAIMISRQARVDTEHRSFELFLPTPKIFHQTHLAVYSLTAILSDRISTVIEPAADVAFDPQPTPVIEPIEEPLDPEPAPVIEPIIEEPFDPAPTPVIEPIIEEPFDPAPTPVIEPIIEEPFDPEPTPVIEPIIEEPFEPAPTPVIEPIIEEPFDPEPTPVIEPAANDTKPIEAINNWGLNALDSIYDYFNPLYWETGNPIHVADSILHAELPNFHLNWITGNPIHIADALLNTQIINSLPTWETGNPIHVADALLNTQTSTWETGNPIHVADVLLNAQTSTWETGNPIHVADGLLNAQTPNTAFNWESGNPIHVAHSLIQSDVIQSASNPSDVLAPSTEKAEIKTIEQTMGLTHDIHHTPPLHVGGMPEPIAAEQHAEYC